MRVLLTTDTVGGVWTFTRELCEGLLARGHAVALVSLGRLPSATQSAWCDRVGSQYGVRFCYEALDVPLEWMEENSGAYSAAAPALMRLADGFHPDVFHANQYCFGALPLNVPKLVTAHSDVLSWAEACRPGGLGEGAWLRTYKTLVQNGLVGADAIAAPTEWMAAALRRGFAVSSGVRVICNGRTLASDTEAPVRRMQAVSAGRRWDEAKGLNVLEGLETSLPVALAGDLTLETGGMLGEDDLLRLFRESSVYLAASVYEPFGLAPLEAALCGCAVVANDLDSLREVWGDGALYFRGPDELRMLLHRLTEKPEELAGARRRSSERAREYTAERMVDGYLSIYSELMDLSQSGRQECMAHAG